MQQRLRIPRVVRLDEDEAPIAQSLAEHTILCTEVLDHGCLLPVQPTGDHHQQELQQIRRGSHLTQMFAARSYNVNRDKATAWIREPGGVLEHSEPRRTIVSKRRQDLAQCS